MSDASALATYGAWHQDYYTNSPLEKKIVFKTFTIQLSIFFLSKNYLTDNAIQKFLIALPGTCSTGPLYISEAISVLFRFMSCTFAQLFPT